MPAHPSITCAMVVAEEQCWPEFYLFMPRTAPTPATAAAAGQEWLCHHPPSYCFSIGTPPPHKEIAPSFCCCRAEEKNMGEEMSQGCGGNCAERLRELRQRNAAKRRRDTFDWICPVNDMMWPGNWFKEFLRIPSSSSVPPRLKSGASLISAEFNF